MLYGFCLYVYNKFYFGLTVAEVQIVSVTYRITQLTLVSPQIFSYRNWNHNWSEREQWFTHQTFPWLTLSNLNPFHVPMRVCERSLKDDRKKMRKRRAAWTDRCRQIDGEKPLGWMPHELSKRCDQMFLWKALSAKRVFGKNKSRQIHLTLSVDHLEFWSVNQHLAPLHTKGVSSK